MVLVAGDKQPSPSERREHALAEIAERLGHTKDQDERYNNGFAHHSLAVHSSYARAHDERLASFVDQIHVTIVEAIPVDEQEQNVKNAKIIVGKTILVNRPIFKNTMTRTRWIENFYQESPSINARARDDQVEIGTKGFAVPVITPFTSSMEEEE